MGCSAGGNLAIQAAVQFTSRENRPDFQILLYPFTTMNDFENNIMFGPDASEELIRKYSVLEQIKPDTPRAFIACSADDQVPTIRLFLSTTASSTSRNCRPERSHLCYTSILPEVMAGAKDPGSITAESGRRNWNAGLSSGSVRVRPGRLPGVCLGILTEIDFSNNLHEPWVTVNRRMCGRGDSNPHALRHQILSLGCLPIPTLPHE